MLPEALPKIVLNPLKQAVIARTRKMLKKVEAVKKFDPRNAIKFQEVRRQVLCLEREREREGCIHSLLSDRRYLRFDPRPLFCSLY